MINTSGMNTDQIDACRSKARLELSELLDYKREVESEILMLKHEKSKVRVTMSNLTEQIDKLEMPMAKVRDSLTQKRNEITQLDNDFWGTKNL